MKPFIVILLSLLCVVDIAADEVVLKTGRVMEGTITERTDEYIILKTLQSTMKIRYSMLDEDSAAVIRGEKSTQVQEVLPVQSQEIDKTLEDWEKWSLNNKDYLEKVDQLQKKYFQSMQNSTALINQAVNKNNYSKAADVAYGIQETVTYLKQELDKISPPEELKTYHLKLGECYKYTLKSIKAWLLGSQQSYYQYRTSSFKAFLAAMEQFAVSNQLMGAPAIFTDSIRMNIELYRKQFLSRMYTPRLKK